MGYFTEYDSVLEIGDFEKGVKTKEAAQHVQVQRGCRLLYHVYSADDGQLLK